MRRSWVVGIGLVVLGLAVFALTGCYQSQRIAPADLPRPAASTPQDTPPPVDPAFQAEMQALYARIHPPDEDQFPVPPDGWYKLELGGDAVDVFRDEYGIPHVFAPNIEAAFRAQAYVLMEDRAAQVLRSRQAVRGLASLSYGASHIEHDTDVRLRGYREDELEAMWDALRPDQQRYLEAYVEGGNDYLARYAPQLEPMKVTDLAAGSVYYLAKIGDWGGEEHNIYKLFQFMRVFKGEQFARNMLDDCIPRDVPNAPTTDHSDRHAAASTSQPEPETARETPPDKKREKAPQPKKAPAKASKKDGKKPAKGDRTPSPGKGRHSEVQSDLDLLPVLRFSERAARTQEVARKDGLITQWGSFCWTVTPERSATGHAMFFGAPYTGFGVPPEGAIVHVVAPGFNVIGMAFHGTPGVMVGHNDRLAWTSTSGLMDVTDFFVETVDPDNPHRYWHNGQWKDMESYDASFPVRNDDGTFRLQSLTVYRTVHGPVVDWGVRPGRVYTRATAFRGREFQSYLAFLDMNFARNMDDVAAAARSIATTHNVFAADTDGNIGYWLSGYLPNRSPDVDSRLPTPGTGEYDWQGHTVLTDVVSSVNPPEGWFGNWNQKPSVKTPLWFPEGIWGIRIFDLLEQENPISWERFWEINRENGMYNFAARYFKPYLLRIAKERSEGKPELEQAIQLLERWPNQNVPGASGALLYNEWMMETMVRLFMPDFGPLVERSMSLDSLKLFAGTMIRTLMPEMAGIPLHNDYLHGRDKDELAFQAFEDTVHRLIAEHGPDMERWPFDPGVLKLAEGFEVPARNCGTYWMAVDLGAPIRGTYLIAAGQSERSLSPHRMDQFDLFRDWQGIPMRFLPDEFERPGIGTAPRNEE